MEIEKDPSKTNSKNIKSPIKKEEKKTATDKKKTSWLKIFQIYILLINPQFGTGVYAIFSICCDMQYVMWLKQNKNQSNHCQVPKMTVCCKWVLGGVNENYQVTPSQNACGKVQPKFCMAVTLAVWGTDFRGRLTAATIPKSKNKERKKHILS